MGRMKVGRVKAELSIELIVNGLQSILYFLFFPPRLLPFCCFLFLLFAFAGVLRESLALLPAEASFPFRLLFCLPRLFCFVCWFRLGERFRLLFWLSRVFFGDGARCLVAGAPRVEFFPGGFLAVLVRWLGTDVPCRASC